MDFSKNVLIGCIVGDIESLAYQLSSIKTENLKYFKKSIQFSDKTVLSVTVAYSLMGRTDYTYNLKKNGSGYYNFLGMEDGMKRWVNSPDNKSKNNLICNSALRRIAPVGFVITSKCEVEYFARTVCKPTHNTRDSIIASRIILTAIFYANYGYDKSLIFELLKNEFPEFNTDLEKRHYKQDVYSPVQTANNAVHIFLNNEGFQECFDICNRFYLDTEAVLAGAMCMAFYKKIPDDMAESIVLKLPPKYIDIAIAYQEWLDFIRKTGLN